MTDKVVELARAIGQSDEAAWIANLWTNWDMQRSVKQAEWQELRRYIFATSTADTSNAHLPWKNSTTRPKLTQIRDNLMANYESSLFPNDRWMQWVGYNAESTTKAKRNIIQAYMENKTRIGGFRKVAATLLADYVDYGNAFATSMFTNRSQELEDGSITNDYIGPKLVRISPEDIVFDPTASTFEGSPKIIRSIRSLGELKKAAMNNPSESFWEDVVTNRLDIQRTYKGFSRGDWNSASSYMVDGFGSLWEYYGSDYVEVLQFFGDWHNHDTGELKTNQVITVVDRRIVANVEDNNDFGAYPPIYHVGWRERQGNLWAMGPLDNLVGMQYRIDHLENARADAIDLVIHPPLKIIGEVEEFVWAPLAKIILDEGGDIQVVSRDLGAIITAANDIELLERKMEEMAGSPAQSAGIRTPGEKTAFEVQALENAAGRIFQNKITRFEVHLIEPILNSMLQQAQKYLSGVDLVAMKDPDLGVVEFQQITKDDIMASGVIRPVGARHFAKQAQDLQNLVGVLSGPMADLVRPHVSGKELTKFIEDVIGLQSYNIFRENAGILEQQDLQRIAQQGQEDLSVEGSLPIPE